MTWLLPALAATITTSIVLAFVNLYLYYQDRERYLFIWGASWLTYSLRFIIHLLIVMQYLPKWMVTIQQAVSIISGLLLVWGTYIFLNKEFPKLWLYGSGFCILWTITGAIFPPGFFLLHLPSSIFIGFMYGWTGYAILRSEINNGIGRNVTAWALIL